MSDDRDDFERFPLAREGGAAQEWRPMTAEEMEIETLEGSRDVDDSVTLPLPVGVRAEHPSPASESAQFGDRLRAETRRLVHYRHLPGWLEAEMGRVAAVIDHDAEALRGEIAGWQRALELVRHDLRRQVEEAVERLSRRLVMWEPECGEMVPSKDPGPAVLDAEPFLEALGAIFRERAEGESERQKAGLELLAWYRGDTGEEAFPTAIARICGVRDPPWTEHEPAHDRRERESARNEDNTGRVEGVDR